MENTAGFLQKRKLRNGLVKPNLSFFGLAEDKRFAQFAVPESAFASRCSLGFFDRCTVFPSLYRPQDALGQNAHAAERATRLEFTCVPKATTHTQSRMGCCWRRTRDSNSRAALATYSLSRGASSPLE